MDLASAPQPLVIVARDGRFESEDVRRLLEEMASRAQQAPAAG
jgi:hypothetical protein